MSDSTKTDNINLHDAGSYEWPLRTHRHPNSGAHQLGVVSITREHQLVHEGRVYSLSGKIAAVGAGATVYFLGLTSTDTVHFRAGAVSSTGSPIDVFMYEDSTYSATGAAVPGLNRNRISSNTPTFLTYAGPTITGLGTALEYGLIPTAGPKGGGISSLFGSEWILKNSSTYSIALSNNDAQPADIGYNFMWYEGED